MSFLDEIAWRGLLHDRTAGEPLDRHLAEKPRIAYAGFDPTSDSLHIGNLVPMTMLAHWQRAGHTPIVVVGGGTGLIGDPSGRDDERSLMTREQVEANVASQRRIFEKVLDFDEGRPNRALIFNNADWLCELGFVEVLRDVGKHFSVNAMIQKESVRARLEEREQGISYTEFSYMLLQAYDFLHLRRTHGCTVQMAGSDQYGNIVAGIDLIRREFGHEAGQAFGITAPLVGRSDGKKMSKSTGEALWLSADTTARSTPWAFYQYWINLPDADAEPWLKTFTYLTADEIAGIVETHAAAPHARGAQRALARHMTTLIHGEAELRRVEHAAEAIFGGGDARSLDGPTLDEITAELESTEHDRTRLGGDGAPLADVLAETTLAKSKRVAREHLASGAISVNGERVGADRRLTTADLLAGRTILLRRGKKTWHATRWA